MIRLGMLVILTAFLECTECIEDIESNTFLYPGDDGNIYRISLNEFPFARELENYTPPTILLYTKKNPKTPFVLTTENLADSNFDKNLETVFLFHGWKDNSQAEFCNVMRNAYLLVGNFNVVVVDWNRTSKKTFVISRKQLPLVADDVVKVIDALVSRGMTSLDRITIVGYSMGAHLGAFVAKAVKGGKVAAVVGLDPAGLVFELSTAPDRLDASDAVYVQVVHTDIKLAGVRRPLGHADFYVNTGRYQPGCPVDTFVTCSHNRAYKLMAASVVRTHDYVGVKCDTFENAASGNCSSDVGLLMGGSPLVKGKGIFYLKTGDEAEEDSNYICNFF